MSSTPRIFVSIPSFRDSETQWTVKDLFEKAAHPERIFVGICWQFDAQEDKAFFVEPYPFPDQVRVKNFDYRDAQGLGWARVQAFELWQGEEYTLQIDSHMRFEPGWDDLLIDMIGRCPTKKAVLSTYAPRYAPPGDKDVYIDEIPRTRIEMFAQKGSPQMVHQTLTIVPKADTVRSGLYPAPFPVGNFLFAPAEVLRLMPLDPHIRFWGEEITYGARLWTFGWDVYQPDKVVAYHYWRRPTPKGNPGYRRTDDDGSVLVYKRIRHLLELEVSDDPDVTVEMDRYGLGKVRPLSGLWEMAGIDWEKRKLAPDAMEGRWKIAAPVEKKLPRIFVNIASYRDPECQWTVKDLFEKATYPDRISVGICWQFDLEKDKHCFEVVTRPKQVRIKEANFRDARGAGWARARAQKLWRGEEYTLQIQAHMRFEQGWDETLIDMLSRCPSEKPALSTYLPRYTPPDNRDVYPGEMLRTRVFGFAGDGHPQILHLGRVPVPLGSEQAGLYPCPFWIGNFLFARSEILSEVPNDPHIFFLGEELAYSARLFTHGWDIFQPDATVLYHFWRRDEHAAFNYYDTKVPQNQVSLLRVKQLLGLGTTNEHAALKELKHYGLGAKRSLEEFWKFAGIEWEQSKIAPEAMWGRWNMSARRMSRKPRIFVNIASYRDVECQWTVKDLFEKAAHPERIFVGICWQFDPQDDKHCFEVVTRPEQVRILPVDWRKAEGVCWARYQTELLHDDEEYTLMIDSHMRFVPGWDDMMIHELAQCKSAKPVLSCSPMPYTPPNQLSGNITPTFRRVKPFMSDGNIRCQGESFDRQLPHPVKGAFLVANFVFARSEMIKEVPYDPYLYFDQEEITYALRLYTYGWEIFSPRRQFLYHYYNDGNQGRPLHWKDLNVEDTQRIRFLRERGLRRFNHITEYQLDTDPLTIMHLDKFGLGPVHTLAEFEAFTGVDFKRKIATDKALRGRFIENLTEYRKSPVRVPEIDSKPQAQLPPSSVVQGLLEPGDSIPLLITQDTNRRQRAIELYGGKNMLLAFLPAKKEAFCDAFFRELYKQVQASPVKDFWQNFVLDDTVDNLIALKEKLKLPHHLWGDPDRGIARAFGAAGGGEVKPTVFIVSPNLRVEHVYSGTDAPALAISSFTALKIAVEAKHNKYSDRRVISETAPGVIVPNVFSKEFCEKCIDAFRTGKTFDGTVGAEKDKVYRPDTKVRTDFIVTGKLLEEIDDKVSRSLLPEIEKVFGFEVTHREMYKIGLYKGEKKGFFKQHRDNTEPPLGYRRIAVTIQLNNDYEGGGLHFPEYDNHIYRPTEGSAICFPCSVLHEALPVTGGERFVVVAFFHGAQDEAYRHFYLKNKGETPSSKDFRFSSRRGAGGIKKTRDFYKDWQAKKIKVEGSENT